MPLRTSQHRMVDRLLDGQLDARLRSLRAEGHGWDEISRIFHAETDGAINVSGQTLKRWGRADADTPAQTEVA